MATLHHVSWGSLIGSRTGYCSCSRLEAGNGPGMRDRDALRLRDYMVPSRLRALINSELGIGPRDCSGVIRDREVSVRNQG